ncbi:VWA domain-containing protein [Maribacter confluentis]|uniref:VWA domain-containing protein n=1 Tax=Maribacter confluentis TaxID=1656093 RepID=A0ABT8RUT5_9FLAO|nr:VWA domain-containing protein [Maribacter confluentis]MDO1514686.1 VWA domain-containing protein [Maribacter confluentis]
MESKTILFSILAAIVALGIVVFQYFYKQKAKTKIHWYLAFLRFIGIFGLLLLLINPKFSQKSYTLEQPNLVLLVDNSVSNAKNKEELQNFIATIKANNDIKERFNLSQYGFGTDLEITDSLLFNDKVTNIHKALSSLKEVYAREQTVTLLLSDGNQTVGQDYSYFKPDPSTTIYSVVLGDTTKYQDISIGPVLTNTYAFLKNRFPLETYVSYQGKTAVSTVVSIKMDDQVIHREKINLSDQNNLKTITVQVDANSVGLKNLVVEASTLPQERNTANNKRSTRIEVIDEKTKIALVSNILHPDIGALKKSIESNEQREVVIMASNVPTEALDDIDLFIYYQPTSSFKRITDYIQDKGANSFFITGTHSDFNFLNSLKIGIEVENGYPQQEVFGVMNNAFSKYDISTFEMEDFPPLLSDAGPVLITSPFETLLGTQIKGVDMQEPLLMVVENANTKNAYLLGENLWKWRMQTFRNTGDFANFDAFVGNLIRYLTSSKNKARLNVDYEKVYEGSSNTIITATYFDEAFIFDTNAKMNIKVTDKATQKSLTNPMILKNGYFEADLSNLVAGEYDFLVTVENESRSASGTFVISEFDMENQFVSSNSRHMERVALNANGQAYYPSQLNDLLQELISGDRYVPIEKSNENIVSLIDFKILLVIIIMAFAIEWFIRKYNGLI